MRSFFREREREREREILLHKVITDTHYVTHYINILPKKWMSLSFIAVAIQNI